MRKPYLLLTLSLLTASVAAPLTSMVKADSWLPPQPKVFSNADGDRTLKVVPTPNYGPGKGGWLTLTANGDEAVGELFPLVNFPVQALIPERRLDYFVTLDSYAAVGKDHSLVIYSNEGKVIKDFKLEDLLTEEEINKNVTATAGSRWWRNGATTQYVIPTQNQPGIANNAPPVKIPNADDAYIHIKLQWGKDIKVRLRDGEILKG